MRAPRRARAYLRVTGALLFGVLGVAAVSWLTDMPIVIGAVTAVFAGASDWTARSKAHTVSKRRLKTMDGEYSRRVGDAAREVAEKFRIRRWRIVVLDGDAIEAHAMGLRVGRSLPWSRPDGLVRVGGGVARWVENGGSDKRAAHAIIAHEFAHMEVRDVRTALAASAARAAIFSAAAMGVVLTLMRWAAQHQQNMPGRGVVTDILGEPALPYWLAGAGVVAVCWAYTVVYRAISRQAEYDADLGAAAAVGAAAMADALRRLGVGKERVNIRNFGRVATSAIVGSTHPPTAKRVERMERLRAKVR